MIGQGEIFEVAKEAGIDPDAILVDAIYDIASEYESLKQTEVRGSSAARKSLSAIKVNLREAFDGVSSFSRSDERAISQLAGIYRSEFRVGPKKLESDVKAVERLASAVDHLVKQMPTGGRPRKDIRDHLFLSLAELYESRTGARFGYPDKRSGFRGSNFVRGMAQLIEPKITDTGCRLAMRAANESLKLREAYESLKVKNTKT